MTDIYSEYSRIDPDAAVIFQGQTAYIVNHELALQVLGDHRRFIKDASKLEQDSWRGEKKTTTLLDLLYGNMLSSDPPTHTRLRAAISKSFTKKRIDELAGRIQEIADELLDEIELAGKVEFIEAYAFPFPIIVICELLGVPASDRGKFRLWSRAFMGLADNKTQFVSRLLEFMRYISQMIAARRAQPQQDLISMLVVSEFDEATLTEQELIGMIALLIVAGHETMTNLLGNALVTLLTNPDQLQALLENEALIESAIEELLRFCGPVELATTRHAAEDVWLGDTLIKRGMIVSVILAAVNRDMLRLEEQNRLDIERVPNQHIGFGHGIHYCVGAPLARLEMKIGLLTLLKRFPDIELAVPAERLKHQRRAIIHGFSSIPIRI